MKTLRPNLTLICRLTIPFTAQYSWLSSWYWLNLSYISCFTRSHHYHTLSPFIGFLTSLIILHSFNPKADKYWLSCYLSTLSLLSFDHFHFCFSNLVFSTPYIFFPINNPEDISLCQGYFIALFQHFCLGTKNIKGTQIVYFSNFQC